MHVSKYNLIFDIEGRKEKILLNPLSRSMDVFDGEDTDLIELLQGDSIIPSGEAEDIEYLVNRGYLFDSSEDEDKMLQDLIERDDREEYPCDFLLYPTFYCNLRCVYCFQNENSPPVTYAMISKDYVDKVFEAIEIISQKRKIESRPLLYLFGGEPLLQGKRARDIIQYILSLAYQKDLRTGIITNGSNLGYYAEILKRFKVEFVQVTMDGPKHIHDQRRKYASGRGTFDDIMHGIASILDSDVKILLRVNLDSQNIDSLPEFAEFIIEAGWYTDNVVVFVGPYRDMLSRSYQYQLPEHVMLEKIFSFYQQDPQTKIIKLVGWPGVDYILYFLHTRRLPSPRVSYCISNYGRFGFDAEGHVYACGTAAGKSKYAIGTFYPKLKLDQDKVHIWRRRRFTDIPECLHCKAALLCGGGCLLQSLLKYQGKRPFCPEVMENIKVVLNYYFDEIVKGDSNVC